MNRTFTRVVSKSVAISVLATIAIFMSRLVSANPLPGTYTTTWIGNSASAAPTSINHVQDNIQALFVGADGTCFTNSFWDEGGNEAGIYGNGHVIGRCVNTHGWGRAGGQSVTSDGTYIYYTIVQSTQGGTLVGGTNRQGNAMYPPSSSTTWYSVVRDCLNGRPAPFPSGKGSDCNQLLVTTNSGTAFDGASCSLTGLTCDNGHLCVADNADNMLIEYDSQNLSQTPISSWPEVRLGALTTDGNGNVWGLKYSGPRFLIRGSSLKTGGFAGFDTCVLAPLVTHSGVAISAASITFSPTVHPYAIAFDKINGMLMVTDQGPNQNVTLYNPTAYSGSPTSVAGTIGVTGGVFAYPTGRQGLMRFNMPSGVGVDRAGNVYVSSDGSAGGGGAILESISPRRQDNWKMYGLEFVDNGEADSNDPDTLYTKTGKFKMNWLRYSPGSEWSVNAYTLDPFQYPEDPRLHLSESAAFVRDLDGKTFTFMTDMHNGNLAVFRYRSTGSNALAIPSTVFSAVHQLIDSSGWPGNEPATGEWIWRDSNGNGSMDPGEFTQPAIPVTRTASNWWPDSNGDVWEPSQNPIGGIRHFVCQGLDRNGNPIYDYSHMTVTPTPPALTDVERLQYYPATDTMYLAGCDGAHPWTNKVWGELGPVIYRYDKWSTTRTLHSGFPIILNYNIAAPTPIITISMAVAGNHVFVSYIHQNWIYVYDASTGAKVGLITPGSSIGGNASVAAGTSLCIGWGDNPDNLMAVQRSDSEIDVSQEDDAYGKIVMYRWALAVPSTPTCVKATISNASVGLSWSASVGADTYSVFRGISAEGKTCVPIAKGLTSTSFTDSTASNGTTYYYKIYATNLDGNSHASSEVSAAPNQFIGPSNPIPKRASSQVHKYGPPRRLRTSAKLHTARRRRLARIKHHGTQTISTFSSRHPTRLPTPVAQTGPEMQ